MNFTCHLAIMFCYISLYVIVTSCTPNKVKVNNNNFHNEGQQMNWSIMRLTCKCKKKESNISISICIFLCTWLQMFKSGVHVIFMKMSQRKCLFSRCQFVEIYFQPPQKKCVSQNQQSLHLSGIVWKAESIFPCQKIMRRARVMMMSLWAIIRLLSILWLVLYGGLWFIASLSSHRNTRFTS